MEGEPVTRLTRQAIKTINDAPGSSKTVVMQYLSRTEQTLKDRVLYSARLSDGTFAASFLLYPTISEKFLSSVAPFDVLEVNVIKKDANSPFMLVHGFRVLYARVGEAVGNAVEYRPGVENAAGDEQLPAHLFEAQLAAALEPIGRAEPPRPEDHKPIGRAEPPRPEDHNVASGVLYTEIANLNMYDRSWNVRGRVIRKSEMKRFRTANREGCVFNVLIKDATRAIQVSLFNEIAEKFYGVLQEGRLYSFADGEVRNASRFNTTDNKYEISLNDKSVIRELPNDSSIATFHFNFVTLEEVQRRSESEAFDLLAIVDQPGAVRDITLKDGTTRELRTVSVSDHTGFQIDVALWGPLAREFTAETDAIVVFQEVRVREFSGKSLTTSMASRVIMRPPDCPQLKKLILHRNGRARGGPAPIALSEHAPARQLRVYKIGQLAAESESLLDEPEGARLFFNVIVYALRVVNNLYYDSCPNDSCMKKLSANTNGTFYCEKCQKTFDAAKPRFMSTIKITDDSGSVMATSSGEEYSQLFFGCPTEHIKALREQGEAELGEFVRERLFGEYRLRLAAKKESYNGESRVRFQVIRAAALANGIEQANDAFYTFLTN